MLSPSLARVVTGSLAFGLYNGVKNSFSFALFTEARAMLVVSPVKGNGGFDEEWCSRYPK